MEELKPYNEASKAQRAEKTSFDSRWSDLDFKNEQQLDEAIASIDYRLSHETNSVADERKLIAELKKLGVRPSLHAHPWYLVRAGRHRPRPAYGRLTPPQVHCVQHVRLNLQACAADWWLCRSHFTLLHMCAWTDGALLGMELWGRYSA